MKTVELNYKELTIDFLVDKNNNIKVNAVQLANIFDKRVQDFTNQKTIKDFIDIYTKSSKHSKENILEFKSKTEVYMDSILGLKFATWLDSSLEIWFHKAIEDLKFEHYSAHFKALTAEQQEKAHFDKLCRDAVYQQNELALQIIESHRSLERFKYDKVNALRRNSRQVNNRTLFNQEDLN